MIRTSTQHHDGRRRLARELPALRATAAWHLETHDDALVSVCVQTNQTVVRVGLTTMLESADVSVGVDAELHECDADVVLFDNDLSPAQIGGLEKVINEEDPDFVLIARTDARGAVGGGLDDAVKRGNEILRNFVFAVCGARPNWSGASFISETVEAIRKADPNT